MKLVKFDDTWYVNICEGKTTDKKEFRDFCQKHDNCGTCPFVSKFLNSHTWDREDEKLFLDPSVVMALLRGSDTAK